ncbi:hypothetical protein SAMN05192553_10618 [Cyclobacterium xiamenense]|uniref:Uncharacterized protein n=1 Tax=Cyclobacterium xiamenense TaxID=1297121 RepID=A0A1H7AFF0_9BACT|nr:hypothetical protein SAMN05192553_10618 [Cyclobacterium xiamenense]
MVFRGKMVSDLGKTSGIVPKKWMNPDKPVDTVRVYLLKANALPRKKLIPVHSSIYLAFKQDCSNF